MASKAGRKSSREFENPDSSAKIQTMSEAKIIETLKQLKEINFYYYVGLKQGKDKGTKIVYMNALGPIDFIYSFDALPVYPENHAVVLQAKRMALDTAQAAEAKGLLPGHLLLCPLRPWIPRHGQKPDRRNSHPGPARLFQRAVLHAPQMV